LCAIEGIEKDNMPMKTANISLLCDAISRVYLFHLAKIRKRYNTTMQRKENVGLFSVVAPFCV
jgi:hypothetical protein